MMNCLIIAGFFPFITYGQDTLIVDNTDLKCTVRGDWNISVRDKPFIGTNYLWGRKGDFRITNVSATQQYTE